MVTEIAAKTCNDTDKDERFSNEEALKNFLLDIKCLESVEAYANKFNVFDVLGITRTEIRHSFFLKWLLDPKENHGLGDAFIKKLIACLVASESERYKDRTFDLLMMDCSDFTVQRELKNMDIFLLSKSGSIAITIENKIGSHEHPSGDYDSQLVKYRNYVEDEYKDIKTKMYVYLTPQNESPSDEDFWQTLSYSEILDITESVLQENKDRLPQEAELLINNYIDILRRDIVQDGELNKVCEKIYAKHRKALDLIYTHSKAGMRPVLRIVSETLREIADEKSGLNSIIYEENDRENFHTCKMTEFLPKLSEPKSSWKTEYPYYYWFKINESDERIALVFELGFFGVDEETKTKMDALIEELGPQNKKESKKYKRVKTYGWIELGNLDEEERKNEIKKMVKAVQEEEMKWIRNCEQRLKKYNA